MHFIEELRLVDGPVLWGAWAAGAAGAAYLVWVVLRSRRPAAAAVLLAASVLVAAALVAAIHWLLVYGFSVFPEELPWEVLAWSLPALAALILWLYRLVGIFARGKRTSRPATPPARRGDRPLRASAASTAAFLGVFLLSQVQINSYFGLNQTVSDLLGTAVARVPDLEPGLQRQPGAPAATALARWQAPADLPDGVLRKASIPGVSSGFQSREAYIYFPPAYQATPRPALPVLVLFAGQPGSPADWLAGGALRARMDKYASDHGGVAPVTVVVDPNGSYSANTLCMDSEIAQADTFLAADVPAWITATLDVDPEPRHWAVGGFSFGATCALQMATRHPDVYRDAIAVASETEPALAKERAKTIAGSFGGDTAAFEEQTPLTLMQHRRYEGHAIYFAVGASDHEFTENMNVLAAAARGAGFAVHTRVVANTGHSWQTASRGLASALEHLGPRWGIK